MSKATRIRRAKERKKKGKFGMLCKERGVIAAQAAMSDENAKKREENDKIKMDWNAYSLVLEDRKGPKSQAEIKALGLVRTVEICPWYLDDYRTEVYIYYAKDDTERTVPLWWTIDMWAKFWGVKKHKLGIRLPLCSVIRNEAD